MYIEGKGAAGKAAHMRAGQLFSMNKPVICIAFIFSLLLPLVAQEVSPGPSPSPSPVPATKNLAIRYVGSLEKGNGIPDKEIWVSYYDEKAKDWPIVKELTDKDGYARFALPLAKDGGSTIFLFQLSETAIKIKVEKIRTGKILGWKMPASGLPPELEFWIDGRHASVKSGSMQMTLP